MKKGSKRPGSGSGSGLMGNSNGDMQELMEEQRRTITALASAVEALANAVAVINDEGDDEGDEDDDAEGDEDKEGKG